MFVGALSVLWLTFSATPSAQTTPPDPGPVVIAPDLMTGRASGAWNLPEAGQPGMVRGRLVGPGDFELGILAKLTPVRLPTDQRGGVMEGMLVSVDPADLTRRTVAMVRGTYLVGADGRGQFEAAILKPVTDPAARPLRIGRIAGVFADPKLGSVDTIGRFSGRWAIQR